MHHHASAVLSLLIGVLVGSRVVAAQPAATQESKSAPSAAGNFAVLAPPPDDRPVMVHADFHLHSINSIVDQAETFEFTGVLVLKWRDKRQAFDPVATGMDEIVFQGNYQFNELSPSWFPQEFLVNKAGTYEKDAVVLRIRPDGGTTLIQSVHAVAKSEFNIRWFPFDRHRMEAVFELIGFDASEAVLLVEPRPARPLDAEVRVPQWNVEGVSLSTRTLASPHTRGEGAVSAFVVSVDVRRASLYILRLVVAPLLVIVLLSFSVFWMDRSSVGDRINVSFIGILTGVAYQIVLGDILPHISYVTLINIFLNLSFLTMTMTVIMNLVVGALATKGRHDTGELLDLRCRWLFPLAYGGLNAVLFGAAWLFT